MVNHIFSKYKSMLQLDFKIKEYEDNIQKLKEDKENIQEKITDELIEKADTVQLRYITFLIKCVQKERGDSVVELARLKEMYEEYTSSLEKYRKNDPERLKQLGTC